MEQGIVYQIREEHNKILPRKEEVYRYLGYSKAAMAKQEDEQVEVLVLEAIATMGQVLTPQAVYAEYEIRCTKEKQDGTLDFSFAKVTSKDLANCLNGCERIAVFAATIGPSVDLLIQKNSRMNPVKALIAQATGAMYIEEFCTMVNNRINEEFKKRGYTDRPRFSPGYGDMPLDFQKDIFRVLSCSKKIGLTLMDTMIMAPSKSVTAIIGYRKEGKSEK